MKLTKLFSEFFESEKAGGVILVCATILSLVLANSDWQHGYSSIWQSHVGGHTITHWINDGLMTIFFLMIGLELEREIYQGELSDLKNAALPIFGALGGMIVPAAIYILFNLGWETISGAGIPMATDIAFAIGILSLLGDRVPASLKVFLTALAVMDDLGAIIMIALFYTSTFEFTYLAIALGIFAILILLNRLRVFNLIPYLIGGSAMWYFMLHSGVHATITGVLLAFAIPFSDGGERSPSYILQHVLHRPVAFIILPIFALANTSIPIGGDWANGLLQLSSIGIMAGLLIGKPLGIWGFTYIATKAKFCTLPSELNWKHMLGAGFLGGIGFTMSIFITLLAFDDAELVNDSKIAILIASVLAGTIGLLLLHGTLEKSRPDLDPRSGTIT